MSLHEEIIDVETASGTMAVVHKRLASGESIGRVGIFFDAPGIRDSTHDFATVLANDGFEVVVPDLYHRHERLFHLQRSHGAMPSDDQVARMRELMGFLDDAEIQQDMDDAMAAVGWGDGPVGCMGFCLGARAVFRAMMRAPERFVAGAMSHPSFLVDDADDSPHLTAGRLSGSLSIGIGTADKVQSVERNTPFFDAIKPLDQVQLRIFDGADHGYTWPNEPGYHDEAATTSYQNAVELFTAAL